MAQAERPRGPPATKTWRIAGPCLRLPAPKHIHRTGAVYVQKLIGIPRCQKGQLPGYPMCCRGGGAVLTLCHRSTARPAQCVAWVPAARARCNSRCAHACTLIDVTHACLTCRSARNITKGRRKRPLCGPRAAGVAQGSRSDGVPPLTLRRRTLFQVGATASNPSSRAPLSRARLVRSGRLSGGPLCHVVAAIPSLTCAHAELLSRRCTCLGASWAKR